MTLEQELRLSYYMEIAGIDTEHGVSLVQDVRSKDFFVKMVLTVYNADIYRYLQQHPIANTPAILLVEEDEQGLTVIEEYIPGNTLEEILEQRGPLTEAEVIEITRQLCWILSDFHHCTPAIINRDINPSNIKLSPDGIVKLLDLNAAKWNHSQTEKDTVLLGTEGYAAPEQYGFGPSSVLTDIYSVGVLMNVMLTGELPNRRLSDGRLRSVIRRCTELSPSLRYQSMEDLLAALDSLCSEEPPEKAPKENTSDWHRFLPPGFRGHTSLSWLLSALGYLLLFSMCASLTIENAGPAETLLNRIFFGLAAVGIVLFTGNYLNVQQKIPLIHRQKPWVRRLGVLLVDLFLFVLAAVLCGILSALFFPSAAALL